MVLIIQISLSFKAFINDYYSLNPYECLFILMPEFLYVKLKNIFDHPIWLVFCFSGIHDGSSVIL